MLDRMAANDRGELRLTAASGLVFLRIYTCPSHRLGPGKAREKCWPQDVSPGGHRKLWLYPGRGTLISGNDHRNGLHRGGPYSSCRASVRGTATAAGLWATDATAVGLGAWKTALIKTKFVTPNAPSRHRSGGRQSFRVDDQVLRQDRIRAARQAFDDLVGKIVKREGFDEELDKVASSASPMARSWRSTQLPLAAGSARKLRGFATLPAGDAGGADTDPRSPRRGQPNNSLGFLIGGGPTTRSCGI